MRLDEIIKSLNGCDVYGRTQSVDITHPAWDTRLLKKGGLYVMRAGKNFDPIEHLGQIKQKAIAILAESDLKEKVLAEKKNAEKVSYIFVEDLEIASGKLLELYSENYKKLNFIGVTGTNGKTTVARTLKHIFDKNKIKSATIGTIAYEWGRNSVAAFMTTPDKENFSTLCAHMVADGVKNVFMEISSHALVLGRVNMVELDAAIFTNLSPEHLDFHKTMEEYALAKTRIYELVKDSGVAIVNADDNYSLRSIAKHNVANKSFALKADADYQVSSLRLEKDSIEFILNYEDDKEYVKTNLTGYFNIQNTLAAIACAHQLGLSFSKITKALQTLKAPQGRMEQVVENVFVDYAHTPDALEKCLKAINELGYDDIVTVFGCGGNRDTSKRKPMGNIAQKYSEYVIVTDDNPRDEDPEQICAHIAEGLDEGRYEIVHDRRNAIQFGLKRYKALNNSALLVAGKGHENYQLIQGVKKHFSDQEVIRELSD